MIVKRIKNYLKIFSSVIFLSSLINPAIAMDDSANQERNELSEKLEKYKGIKQNDPPFFKITLSNNKVIYIIGSVHPLNPYVLLSEAVFQEIEKIAPTAMLFTEHPGTYDMLFEQLETAGLSGNDQWDIQTLLQTQGQRKSWAKVENDIINAQYPFTINHVQKLPITHGIMFLKAIISKKYKKYIPGFEETLKKLPWINQGGILSLETGQEALKILEKYPDDLADFFSGSLKRLMKGIREENDGDLKELNNIESHANASYGYEFLKKSSKEIKPSTLERNEIWPKAVVPYLKNDHGENTIFIICGKAHLANLSSNENFLALLLISFGQNDLEFSRLERMNNDGQWVELN